jgi:hypothetical protein
LRTYLSTAKLSTLNQVETALLVKHFAVSESDRCKAISENVRQIVGSQHFDIKEFKRLFDSVLKAQATTESPVLVQTTNADPFGNFSNMMQVPMAQPMMQNIAPAPMYMQQNIAMPLNSPQAYASLAMPPVQYDNTFSNSSMNVQRAYQVGGGGKDIELLESPTNTSRDSTLREIKFISRVPTISSGLTTWSIVSE